MPPVPRLQLSADFRAAVKADGRGIVRLAHLIGLTSYTQLSALLNKPRFKGSDLNQDRLRRLAEAVGFIGPLWHERRDREVAS